MPFPETFLAPIRKKQIAGMPRLKNSFWFITRQTNQRRRASTRTSTTCRRSASSTSQCWPRCSCIVSARQKSSPNVQSVAGRSSSPRALLSGDDRRLLRTASHAGERGLAHLVAARPGFLHRLSRRDRLRRHEDNVARAPAHARAERMSRCFRSWGLAPSSRRGGARRFRDRPRRAGSRRARTWSRRTICSCATW